MLPGWIEVPVGVPVEVAYQLVTMRRSPSMVPVTVRATSAVQIRSFDGRMVDHHMRNVASNPAYTVLGSVSS